MHSRTTSTQLVQAHLRAPTSSPRPDVNGTRSEQPPKTPSLTPPTPPPPPPNTHVSRPPPRPHPVRPPHHPPPLHNPTPNPPHAHLPKTNMRLRASAPKPRHRPQDPTAAHHGTLRRTRAPRHRARRLAQPHRRRGRSHRCVPAGRESRHGARRARLRCLFVPPPFAVRLAVAAASR